jgi:hypothetical protein
MADFKMDLFAFGCTIYFILMGYHVFPDIINGEEGWHDKVQHRFEEGQFRRDRHACLQYHHLEVLGMCL